MKVRQAKLPKGAYDGSTEGMNYFAYKISKKWCKNHPTALWTEGYKQCSEGFRKKETCIKGNE